MDKCVKKLGMGTTSKKASAVVENQRARKLYEEIFEEDSQAFVDYYFRVKAAENEIFVVEGNNREILATLHLNPYPVNFCKRKMDTNYIVAVATRADCRHQGMMRSLLQASLQEMYRRKEAFTWLMPAAEAIYHPFGFRFIYEKNKMILTPDIWKQAEKNGVLQKEADGIYEICCREARKEDLEELECFANAQISKFADVYTVHDVHYFEQRMQEVQCEGGSLVLLQNKKGICGYFLALKKQREAWEIVVEDFAQKQALPVICRWFETMQNLTFTAFPKSWEAYGKSEKRPAIMGRIVHLEQFVSCLRTKKKQEWNIRLSDSLIPENNGYFRIRTGPDQGEVRKIADSGEIKAGCRDMDIGELTEVLFELSVFLNEVV